MSTLEPGSRFRVLLRPADGSDSPLEAEGIFVAEDQGHICGVVPAGLAPSLHLGLSAVPQLHGRPQGQGVVVRVPRHSVTQIPASWPSQAFVFEAEFATDVPAFLESSGLGAWLTAESASEGLTGAVQAAQPPAVHAVAASALAVTPARVPASAPAAPVSPCAPMQTAGCPGLAQVAGSWWAPPGDTHYGTAFSVQPGPGAQAQPAAQAFVLNTPQVDTDGGTDTDDSSEAERRRRRRRRARRRAAAGLQPAAPQPAGQLIGPPPAQPGACVGAAPDQQAIWMGPASAAGPMPPASPAPGQRTTPGQPVTAYALPPAPPMAPVAGAAVPPGAWVPAGPPAARAPAQAGPQAPCYAQGPPGQHIPQAQMGAVP